MKIKVKSKEERRIWLWFPTRLICNSLTAFAAAKIVSMTAGARISYEEMRHLFHVIHKCKRKMKNQYLVDIESSDGDIVRIKL